MTFGSVFGRTFSPTFQPSSQAVAAGGGTWWDLNGTITSCVAAYQPKGAASYAASLVDLSGNSNDLTKNTDDPSWDSATGWSFTSKSDNLVTPTISMRTVIVLNRVDTIGSLDGLMNKADFDGENIRVEYSTGTPSSWYIPGNYGDFSSEVSSPAGFVNGENSLTIITGNVWNTITSIRRAAINLSVWFGGGKVTARLWLGNIGAIAIYNAVLTQSQVQSLTTAMKAL